MKKDKITYSQVGDDYSTKDPIKKLALAAAASTAKNLKNDFEEVSETRGESAYVWKQGDIYMASVIEGLGTKNLVADQMRKITGKTYYDVIANDTIAYIINDLITVGARPLVIHAYWAIEDNSWLNDQDRMEDLINGWKKACDLSGASWGGGETATDKGVIEKDTIDLAGSAVGIIGGKDRLITDKKMQSGDRILLIGSNGINASGISLARAVAKRVPKGYVTKLSDGTLYGEAILTKCNIYARLVNSLLDNNIDIHYISFISGHGMRKIMRARQQLTYVIEKIFEPQEVFNFIQKHAGIDDYEMYQTFNMGQDYAIFISPADVEKAQQIISQNGFESLDGGYVENGPRQVIIKPKNIIFEGKTLDLR
ncbi:MAG: AIR synthase related protein [Patescibacteria group bacterium]